MMERSVLGLIYTYNLLPEYVVGSGSISTFQRKLQNGLKQAAELDAGDWQFLFRAGIKQMSVTSFQALFG